VILDTRVAAVLLHLFQSAERQVCAPPRLFLAHAGSYEVADPLLQMETQFRVQPFFRLPFPK
jgi:hypothetical protein